jgi:ATP-dependent DNA helicase RecG
MSEHQQLEYKKIWKDEFLKVICAFANADGGRLVVGCADDGSVVGVSNAQKLLEDIPNKVRDVLGIIVDVSLLKEKSVDFIEIEVASYSHPISFRGEYFYRTGSTTQALKGVSLDRFLLRKQGLHWDGVPVPKVGVSNLDSLAFKQFRKLAANSGRMAESVLADKDRLILENLRLLDEDYLKRAAVLLFHPDPEAFIPGAYIKIGFFETETELRYQDEIHGNLFVQVEKTLELLLTKYMKAYISYEGIQRIETFLFPKEALREALLNAVVHRDYSTGVPIQIKVFENRLIIWNHGHLPAGWSIERLIEEHSSEPFNPLLANAFFRSGQIESWGRGIQKIMEACRLSRCEVPVFRFDETGLAIEFRGQPENGREARVEAVRETVGETVGEILRILRENPGITREGLSQATGLSVRGVEWNLSKLKKNGRLIRVGPNKGGHWEVMESE